MQVTNSRLDEHEFGLDEMPWDLQDAIMDETFSPIEYRAEGFKLWILDPVIRIALIEELQQQGEKYIAILRDANRLVARAARRRAQHKKINLPTPFSMRPQLDAARDIQAYVNLLASIDGSRVKKGTSCDTSLRLASDDIFAIGEKFDPTAALRFAYLGLMREDIDRDFRLSMVTDQDSLRLRLYYYC